MRLAVGLAADAYNKPVSVNIPMTGLFGWWDAADDASFVYSEAPTKSIGRWNDRTATGWNFHQTSTWQSEHPKRDIMVNGKPAVRFPIIPDPTHLLAMTVPGSTARNITQFVVGCADPTATGWQTPFFTGATNGATGGFGISYRMPSSATVVANFAWANDPPASQLPMPTVPCVARLSLDAAGKAKVFVNGIEGVPNRTDVAVVPTVAGGMKVFGTLCEILHYERALTAAEIAEVDNYLAAKWGVALPPGGVGGLAGWYDAAHAASFTGGTLPAFTRWADRSGNNLPMDNIVTATRSGTQNGKPTVVIGNGGYIWGAEAWSLATDNITMVVACGNRTGGAGNSAPMYNGNSGGNGYGPASVSGFFGMIRSSDLITGSAVPYTTAPTVLVLARTAGLWSLHRDGVVIPFTGAPITTAPTAPINRRWFSNDSVSWFGDIYEGMFYSKALTTLERYNIEKYLSDKWGTPAWTPDKLSGLIGWWDATKDGDFTYSNGNDPANPANKYVSQWADRSGNGNTAVANTGNAGYHPHRDATINGLKAVDFGQPGSYINIPKTIGIPTWFGGQTKPSTYALAFRFPAALLDQGWLIADATGLGMRVRSTGAIELVVPGVANIGITAAGIVVPNETCVLICDWAAGGAWTIYKNGLSVGSGTAANAVSGTTPMALGDSVPGNAYPVSFVLGEAITYNRVLTTLERQNIEAYLKTKWGTP